MEVQLGNIDIVQSLLELDHDPNGTPGFRPLAVAIRLNHEPIFHLLLQHGAKIEPSYLEDDGITLLQLFATRSQSSRPGISIASQLIDAGVPIESGLLGARPPFALSLINQYFDLSDVLYSHGSKVNELYQMAPDGP